MKKTLYLLLCALLYLVGVQPSLAQSPTAQARYIATTNVQATSLSLAWINGNGNRRIVVAYDTTANGAPDWDTVRTYLSSYNSEYTANSDFSSAPSVGATLSNYKVVGSLTSSARTLTVTGLIAGHVYSFHVFEYNYYGTTAYYMTSAGTTLNPRNINTVDLLPPSGLTNGTVTNNTANISWTHATGALGYYLDVRLKNGAILANYDLLDIGYVNSYIIVGLSATTQYEWRLRSYNANTISAASSWQEFTTTAAPAAPTVSSVIATPDVLNKAGDAFSIAVTFSEEMDPTAIGTLTFSTDVSSTLTFSYGYWNATNTVYTAVYNVASASTQYAANVGVTVPVDFTSAAGVQLSSAHNENNVFTIDRQVPTVTSVSSTTSDGTYGIGSNINVRVTFSEAVTFSPNGGSMQIELETGTTDRFATSNTSQTSTTTLDLTYTVQEGDVSSDLDYTTTNAFTLLNDATIKDASGNDAVLTLPTVGGASSIAGQKAIVIDGVRPTVSSITKQTPASQKTNVNSLTWRVEFSEPVTNASVTTGDFELVAVSGDITGASITGVSPTIVTDPHNLYDVTANVTGINAEIKLNFTGSVTDAASNASAVGYTYTTGETYIVDHTNPSATISSPANNSYQKSISSIIGTASDVGTPNSGVQSVEIAIWVDNNTNGSFDAGDYYWNGSNWTTATNQTWVNATTSDSWVNWSYSLSITSGDAVYYVERRVVDQAGNTFADTEGSTTHRFYIDNTAPTQAAPTVTALGGTVRTGYFNTTNTGFRVSVPLANDATLVGGNFKVQYQTADDAAFSSNPSSWTDVSAIATHSIQTGEPNTTIDKNLTSSEFLNLVAEGKYIRFRAVTTDAAGNSTNGNESSATLRDATLPTISSSSSVDAASNGATDYLDITFSEPVYTNNDGTGALTASDFNLTFSAGTDGTATGASITGIRQTNSSDYSAANALSGGETTVRVFLTVTGTPNGNETITITPADASSIYDVAGNAMQSSQTTGSKSLPDRTPPQIYLVSDNGATFVKENSSVTITFFVTEVGGFSTGVNPVVEILQNDGSQIGGGSYATFSSRTGSGTLGD
ncbi:MAG TPA: fibronectin type III domain-containing protein, partial [Candidatus Kapabacteria bacterium]|nr:fibronectin type III domain-containing protein [Candidatus Kapabacteria bacterium]